MLQSDKINHHFLSVSALQFRAEFAPHEGTQLQMGKCKEKSNHACFSSSVSHGMGRSIKKSWGGKVGKTFLQGLKVFLEEQK